MKSPVLPPARTELAARRVLLVEDSESDAQLVRHYLQQSHLSRSYTLCLSETLDEALSNVVGGVFDVVLLDLGLPDSDGLMGLGRMIKVFEGPIIVLSGLDDETHALEAVRNGAQDYLLKAELGGRSLERSISYAIERYEMMSALEVSRCKAELASRAKSDFLAVMSHEFRTPMHGLLGCLNLIKDHEIPVEIAELLETVEFCAQGQLSLINDILDLSQIEAGGADLLLEDCNVREVVDGVVGMMRLTADAKNLAFAADIDPQLEPLLNTDARRLRQILVNLVGNAIKFTNEGEVRLVVQADGPKQVRFDVLDTGIGIPEDMQQLIFEEFTQVDASRNRRFQGTGLGLAICKKLVCLLGGDISVSSVLGSGTTLSFTIPTDSSCIPASHKETDERHVPDEGFSEVYPISVLLVEDSLSFQSYIKKVFSVLGYDITIAQTGDSAVDLARSSHFDLVIMDLSLPGIDGFEAAEEIRRLWSERGLSTRIVAATVYESTDMQARCLAAGFDSFVSKPCEKDDLKRVIEACFEAVV